VLQVYLISQDPVFLGHSKYQRLRMERLDLVMFITLLLRLTIAQAWTTSCTSEQRGEFASVQGPGPTEGADRKEQRKMDRENDGGWKRERKRNSARLSRSGALLDSIFIPLINSILVVHRSFIRAPTSHSISFSLSLSLSLSLSCARARLSSSSHFYSIPLFVLYGRVNRHVHSFRLCLTSARIADIPLSALTFLSHSIRPSLSLLLLSFLLVSSLPFPPPLPAPPRPLPLAQPGTSLPLVPLSSPRDIFSLSSLPRTLLLPIWHIRSAVNAVTYVHVARAQRSNDVKELYWCTRWWMRCSISFRLQ